MKELPQNYDAAIVEKKWQDEWEQEKIYAWDSEVSREDSFVIDTPPPTISGQLHMGHIFSYTQTDFIARYKRMQGFNIFYPMGFDDNGLPTERLVEKEKKKKAYQYPSREDFIKDCEEVAEKYRLQFRNLFKSIALSVDWKQEYHTISDEVMKISQMSFIDLYNKGLVERKLEPMFWDPIDQTAIAQAEIEEKELDSFENYIWFGLRVKEGEHKGKFVKIRNKNSSLRGAESDVAIHTTNGQASQTDGLLRSARNDEWVAEYTTQSDPEWFKGIEVMTTRPEMLPACVAFMYHPEDERAEILKNCEAITPLFHAIVPTIADEAVQKDKGTGVVMCCTFGDEQDVRWWKAHKLELKIILDKFGKISIDPSLRGSESDTAIQLNKKASQADGLLRPSARNDAIEKIQSKKADHQEANLSARKIVIKLLEENGLTAKEKKKITHPVKCAERSGSPLEIIPTHQWFVKVLEFKEQLKQKALECNWNPDFMKVRILQWIDSLSWDWCISRQRYFGVPFPVWYVRKLGSKDPYNIIIATPDNLPVNPLSKLPKGLELRSPWKEANLFDCYVIDDLFDIKGKKIASAGEEVEVIPDTDVMDTWATSSISPQINSGAISSPHLYPLPKGEDISNPLSLRERVGVRAKEKKYSPKELIENARDLRKTETKQEEILWYFLRNRNLNGYKFRRQHPVEHFIADFACLEANLIIELDGGQHNEDKSIKYDDARSKFLESKGFKIIRFWNNEINENLEGVLESILNNLTERCLHPNPLPEVEGTSSRHQKLFPADLRPQAHEIIRTWAFYTIVKAMHHENTIPWKNLMISGWCLAEDKTKMSKSKGNVVTPEEVLKENSADVIRYWASTSKLGADTAFSKETLKIGKKLTNKLWNATKFASIHLNLVKDAKTAAQNLKDGIIFEPADKAIISKLHQVVLKATEEFELFEYSVARTHIEEFFWKDFCDNYLEIIKTRIYNEAPENEKSRLSAAYAVYHSLESLLRLFAPFLPHITEELYQAIFEPKQSIHDKKTWPNVDDYFYDESAIKENDVLVLVLEFVRKYKAEKNISIKFPIEKISINCDAEFKTKIEKIKSDLQNVISAKELVFSSSSDDNFSNTEDKKVKIKLEILAVTQAA